MNTYQLIVQFISTLAMTPNNPLTLRQACLGGELPVSYRQAQRVVQRAKLNGDLKVERAANQQGRPLKASPK